MTSKIKMVNVSNTRDIISYPLTGNPGGTPFGATGGPPEALVNPGNMCPPPPAWPNIAGLFNVWSCLLVMRERWKIWILANFITHYCVLASQNSEGKYISIVVLSPFWLFPILLLIFCHKKAPNNHEFFFFFFEFSIITTSCLHKEILNLVLVKIKYVIM